MSDTSKYDSRDFSAYDTMETEELRKILRADIESENQEQDTQMLLYIMNLLAEREEKSTVSRKTPEEAYAEFREFYDYSDEDVTDAENISDSSEESAPQKPRRVIPFMKHLPKIAIITIISLGITAALTMSVDAIRKPFMDYIISQFSHHTTILFSSEYEEVMPMEDDIWESIENAPVPDGYFLDKKDIHEKRLVTLRYNNQTDGNIHVLIRLAGGVFDYDTEGFDRRDITINGHEGIVYTKDDGMMIVWLDEKNSAFYYIRTYNLDENNFWEVANYWASKRIKMGEDYE